MFGKYFKNNQTRPRDSISINLKLLRIFGLWFPEENTWSWRSKLYLIYAILFQGFFFYLYVFSETAEMMFSFGNIEKMTEASFLLLTHYAEAYKVKNVITIDCVKSLI